MNIKSKIYWLVISMLSTPVLMLLSCYGNIFENANSQNIEFSVTNSLVKEDKEVNGLIPSLSTSHSTLNNLVYENKIEKSEFINNLYAIAESENKIVNSSNSLIEHNVMNNQIQIVSDILPPNILFNYNNTDYYGKLISYKYREGYSFNESDIRIKNLTNHFSKQNSILINNGSQVKFLVKEYPERIEPLTLFVTVYQIDGNIVKVLRNLDNLNNQENTYRISLPKGNYLLIATSTSIPETSKNVGGYVMYAYSVTIK